MTEQQRGLPALAMGLRRSGRIPYSEQQKKQQEDILKRIRGNIHEKIYVSIHYRTNNVQRLYL